MTSIEKRKYPRYEAQFFARCKELDKPNAEWYTVQVKNISLGGMLLKANQKFPISANLLFNLQAFITDANIGAEIIELRVKVLGVVESTVNYDTRVTFIELNELTKSMLKEFLDCLSY